VKSVAKQSRWNSYSVAWLLLAALIAVGALAVYTFMAYRSAAIELLIERDRQVTYLSSARIRSELSKFSDALETFARTQALYDRSPAVRRQALQDSLLVREGVFDAGLILLDNHGKVLAAEPARTDVLLQDWSDRDYFRRLLSAEAPIFSSAVTDGPEGEQVIVVSVPVFGARNEFVGALLGMLRLGQSTLSPFYAMIVRLRIGQSGTTYLIDGNGNILFDSGSRSIGLPYSSYALPGLVFDPQGGAVRTQDADGNEIVAAYAPVPGTSWILAIEDDWATLTSDTRRYMRLLTALLSAGLLLPAAGVVMLLRRRQTEIEMNETAFHGTRAARLIKESLMPKHAPVLPGWRLQVHNHEGEAVTGDFHDMLLLPDGRLTLTAGHITAEDLPAMMLLATARATLRGTARCLMTPADALARSNEFLCPETPEDVSITCFYALLDPASGTMQYANAGHELAFYRTANEVVELPTAPFHLGVDLDAMFDQDEIRFGHGEYLLLCHRNLVEAANLQGDLFGADRLKEILRNHPEADEALGAAIRMAVNSFTDTDWEQDHELVLVTVERLALPEDDPDTAEPVRAKVRA